MQVLRRTLLPCTTSFRPFCHALLLIRYFSAFLIFHRSAMALPLISLRLSPAAAAAYFFCSSPKPVHPRIRLQYGRTAEEQIF